MPVHTHIWMCSHQVVIKKLLSNVNISSCSVNCSRDQPTIVWRCVIVRKLFMVNVFDWQGYVCLDVRLLKNWRKFCPFPISVRDSQWSGSFNSSRSIYEDLCRFCCRKWLSWSIDLRHKLCFKYEYQRDHNEGYSVQQLWRILPSSAYLCEEGPRAAIDPLLSGGPGLLLDLVRLRGLLALDTP